MQAKMINYKSILPEFTMEDYKNMFSQSLFKSYGIIISDVEEHDETKTYKLDDIVSITTMMSIKKIYRSLKDDNNEPLNNDDAWEEMDCIVVDSTMFNMLKSFLLNIVPNSFKLVKVKEDDEAGILKIKYILGLFLSCLILQTTLVNSKSNPTYSGRVKYLQIDGITTSYAIPNYLLDEKNMFYANNPYGMQLLSLKHLLFTSTPLMIQDFYEATYNTFGFKKH